jgi:hypothetical protein
MKAVKEFKRLVWRRVLEGKKTGKGGGSLKLLYSGGRGNSRIKLKRSYSCRLGSSEGV